MFVGRHKELDKLSRITGLSETSGYLTMITGKRRIGKTTLATHFVSKHKIKHCYFFVSRKQSKALLTEFTSIITFNDPGFEGVAFNDFEGFFKYLFELLKRQQLTIIFDEFQNFHYVDPAVFSIFQKYWDANKDIIQGHIIVIGSVQTMMGRIFEDQKEPLFKRLTDKIILPPLSHGEINELIKTKKRLSDKKQMILQLIFDGIPYYYYLIQKQNLYNKPINDIIQSLIIEKGSILNNEGMELLIEEFGKKYNRYFSILEAIASGHTQWNEIANHSGISANSLGKYLDELMHYYFLIECKYSIFNKMKSKSGRYYLKDPFLTFWFRYVYKNKSFIEHGAVDLLMEKINTDLPNFFGYRFEQMIVNWIAENTYKKKRFDYDHIGKYWDKGKNEIDVVAHTDNYTSCLVGECKWSHKRITSTTIKNLDQKVEVIQSKRKFKQIKKAIYVGDRMPDQKRKYLSEKNIQAFDLFDYFSSE